MAVQRIPLTQPIESRNGTFTKDSRSVNGVFETRDEKREFIKRPGLAFQLQLIYWPIEGQPPAPPPPWKSQGLAEYNGKLVSVIDNIVQTTTVEPIGIPVFSGATSSTSSQSYFARTFNDAYLFIQNTDEAYLLDKTNTVTQITNDRVYETRVDNGGMNYCQGSTNLIFSDISVTGACTIQNGSVVSVTMYNIGSGLVAAPTCTIDIADTVVIGIAGLIGSFTITVASALNLYVGMFVTGLGIAPNARVVGIGGVGGLTVTLDLANVGGVGAFGTFEDKGFGAVLTPILTAFPDGPFVAGAVSMDNYLFIGTTNNRIYNSAPGNPKSWGALDYISFEQTADQMVAICKHLNYIVAFGERSTQFFYDAGNTQGSPLAVSQSYTSEIGCAVGSSVVATDNTVLWIGISTIYGRSVFLMDGVTPVRVSTSNIERHLEADDLSKVNAFCHKYNGHLLYILTLNNTRKTLVYDLTEKMWYQWTQYAMATGDDPNPGTYYESYFRPLFYAEVRSKAYCLEDDTSNLYWIDTGTYADNAQHIYCRTVTDIADNGSTHRKFYGRLEIVGDKVAGIMQIRHTGDDYNTWSTYREVNLNDPRAQIYLSGSDRRRAWEFLCTSDVPLRLDAAEIDFRIGEMDQEQGIGGGRYRK